MKTDNLTDAYHFGEAPDETIASSSTDCIYRADAERAIADVISRGGTEAEILTEIHFLPAASLCYGKCQLSKQAADIIHAMSKRVEFLRGKIADALDALDRGADNDWARQALEEAEKEADDVC